MPRVYEHKARRDYPAEGIRKGDVYYEWAHRAGRTSIKRRSRTRPRRAQLTLSSFLSTVYDIWDVDIPGAASIEDMEGIAESLREAGSEAEDSRSSMPDSLQDSPTGEMLQTRADSCEEAASAIDSAVEEIREEVEAAEAWAAYRQELEEFFEARDPDADKPEPPESDDPGEEVTEETLVKNAMEQIEEPDWG